MTYYNPLTALLVSLFHSYPSLSLDQRLSVLASILYAVEPSAELLNDIEVKIARAREYEMILGVIKELYRRGEIEKIELDENYRELRRLEIEILGTIIRRYMGSGHGSIKDKLLGK